MKAKYLLLAVVIIGAIIVNQRINRSIDRLETRLDYIIMNYNK